MSTAKNIGGFTRAARLKARRSQSHLARAIGTSQPYIDKLEHNQVDPRYSTVLRVLDELGYALVAVPKSAIPHVNEFVDEGDEKPLIDSPSEEPG